MTSKWQVRSDERWAFVQALPVPDPKAGEIEPGDLVVLYLDGDKRHEAEVHVQVASVPASGPIWGVLALVAREDHRSALGGLYPVAGTPLEFARQNVFRLQKAS